MPAVPPARREWAETIVNFSIGDAQIKWPPKDWREMNSDKKLHAWEFVSTQLEFLLTGSFPIMGTAGIQPIVNMSFACLVVLSPFIVELAMVVVLLLDALGVLWITGVPPDRVISNHGTY
jgi:hypothetical protein